MKLYSAKEVYLDLGISQPALYYRIKAGHYPPLDIVIKDNRKFIGYFESTFNVIKTLSIPKVGRPRKIKY